MHVIHPKTYRPHGVPKKRSRIWLYLLIFVALLGGGNYLRPLPAATASFTIDGLDHISTPDITWPSGGQAAIGAPGYGILATHGTQTPLATASIAKVITALCVLQKQPLDVGQSGPTYTISSQDVQIYNQYVAGNGSVIAVTAGEKLTEYQALQAIMLPSANNIADSLVDWVFGSHQAYATYASDYLANHGLTQTTIGSDASGYDASTTSSASDLTKLGLLALKSPVLMNIAQQKSALLPVAGTVYNYDTVLGVNGITGLKTGNNDANPGAFLFTANVTLGTKSITVAGAVMGAADLNTALQASTKLATSLQLGFQQTSVAAAGQKLGAISTKWGASQPIVTSSALQITHWKDTAIGETHTITPSLRAGKLGRVTLHAPGAKTQTNLVLRHDIAGPGFWWRLTRH